MFALARTSSGEPISFEFGEPLEPYVPLETKILWIMEDYENRRDEFFDLSISQSVARLAGLLAQAGDDPVKLLPPIRALGFVRSPNGAPALIQLLAHPSRDVQRESITSLGRIGSLEGLRRIEGFRTSPDRDIRRAAIIALGRSLDPEALLRMDEAAGADPELGALLREGRRRLDAALAGDVPALTNAVIGSEEFEDLVRLLEVASGQVLQVLEDRRRELVVRLRAVRVVSLVRSIQAGRHLAPIVANADEPRELRIQATIAAGRCGAKTAVGPLIEVLDGPDAAMRAEAVTSLGRIGSSEALDPLLGKWDAGGGVLRERIRLALSRLCFTSGRELLTQFLRAGQPWSPDRIYFIDDRLELTTGYREGLLDAQLSAAEAPARHEAILLLGLLAGPREAAKLARLRDQDEDAANQELAGLAVANIAKE